MISSVTNKTRRRIQMPDIIRPSFYASDVSSLLGPAGKIARLWYGSPHYKPSNLPTFPAILDIHEDRLRQLEAGERPTKEESDKILALYLGFLQIRLNTDQDEVDLLSPEFFNLLRSGNLIGLGAWRRNRKFPVAFKPEIRSGIQTYSHKNKWLARFFRSSREQPLKFEFSHEGWTASCLRPSLGAYETKYLQPDGFLHHSPHLFADTDKEASLTALENFVQNTAWPYPPDREKLLEEHFVFKDVLFKASKDDISYCGPRLSSLKRHFQRELKIKVGGPPQYLEVVEEHDGQEARRRNIRLDIP
jgi:hypothetical protein